MWQKIKTALAIAGGVLVFVGIFLAGLFTGRKFPAIGPGSGIFSAGGSDSAEISRREAAAAENGRRVASDIGQVKESGKRLEQTVEGLDETSKRLKRTSDRLEQSNNDLGKLAEGLRRIGNSGEDRPKN